MRRAIIAVVLIGCLFQPAALVAQSSEFDPEKIQVLILTGLGGHAWRETTPLLREMLEITGRFEVRVMEEFRGAGPETLAPYDVVILNMIHATSGGDTIYDVKTPRWWGERAERAFVDFVRSGRGFVHRHISLAAFDGWTEFEQMSGGNWRFRQSYHSPQHDFSLDIVDSEHPITRGLKSPMLVSNDELYAGLVWQPEGSYRVLATAWDEHALYTGIWPPPPRDGMDQPLLWTTRYGEGRVFATALGHGPDNVRDQAFRVTFVRGVEWAATGQVTLPIPPELAAN